MTVLKLGILGLAKIARTHVIPALAGVKGLKLCAIASRDAVKVRQFCAQLPDSPQPYNDYEALLESDLDAVYIPLPNDGHIPWTLAALERGKHVLCEKPLALSIESLAALDAAQRRYPHLKVMEAFMYGFHPQWQQVDDWVQNGRIGDLRSVEVRFCYHNTDPANIRNNPAAGGGAFWDVGCYGVDVARRLLGGPPEAVFGRALQHTAFGVDDTSHALLHYPQATASITVSTKAWRSQTVAIEGDAGRIELSHPFYRDAGEQSELRCWTQASYLSQCYPEVAHPNPDNQYARMLQAFAEAIATGGEVPLPIEASRANARTLIAVQASFAAGSVMTV